MGSLLKKLRKTFCRASRQNFAQIVMFDFNQTSQNDFAHAFAKSMICYSARSRLGSKTASLCGSKLDFSTREKNHQCQLVDTICAKSGGVFANFTATFTPTSKSFLVLFFKKEQHSYFCNSPINQNLYIQLYYTIFLHFFNSFRKFYYKTRE